MSAGLRFVHGMLWVLRSGAHWHDLPELMAIGRRHRRFARWAGVWERVFEHLIADPDNGYVNIDSSLVRADQQAGTGKGGGQKSESGSGAFPRRTNHQDPYRRRWAGRPLKLIPTERLTRSSKAGAPEQASRASAGRGAAHGRDRRTQVSLSDPDARAVAPIAGVPRVVGYNLQTVVEAKHRLILAHEVTHHGYDRDAPHTMALSAREAMGSDTVEVVADKGGLHG